MGQVTEVRVKGSEKALKDFNEIDIIRLMFLKGHQL